MSLNLQHDRSVGVSGDGVDGKDNGAGGGIVVSCELRITEVGPLVDRSRIERGR